MERLPKSRQLKVGDFVVSNYKNKHPWSEEFWVVYPGGRDDQFILVGQGKANNLSVSLDYLINRYYGINGVKKNDAHRTVKTPPFRTNDKYVTEYFEKLEKEEG